MQRLHVNALSNYIKLHVCYPVRLYKRTLLFKCIYSVHPYKYIQEVKRRETAVEPKATAVVRKETAVEHKGTAVERKETAVLHRECIRRPMLTVGRLVLKMKRNQLG